MKSILNCAVIIALAGILSSGRLTGQSSELQSSVKLSGKTIAVKYSAPAMAGRKIFGELVPFGKIWPVGGAAATLRTDSDLDFQGIPIPKGEYTLYILPDAKACQLIISKQTAAQSKNYDQKMDVGRVQMRMTKPAAPIETFSLKLTGTGLAGKLELGWENTSATASFFVDAVKKASEW